MRQLTRPKQRWLFTLATSLLISLQLSAEDYLDWHDIIGRSFEAKIISASAQKVKLENRDGKQIDFPIADLKPSSKDQVKTWQAAQIDEGRNDSTDGLTQDEGKSSVFDDLLMRNLVKLEGKKLKSCRDATRPKKYYLFYYTASWCGPCQKFTPTLVKWYNKNKNDNFELVLITSDSNEDAMEGYAVGKKMPWPLLKFKKAKNFKKRFPHGVRGIPSLIVCDIDGKNLGNFRSRLDELKKMIQ